MKLTINNTCGKELYSAEADSIGALLNSAVRFRLRSANLEGADLRSATVIDTGETWGQYLAETVPALLTSGGRPLSEVATAEHWDCHSWCNCPMAAAFDAAGLDGVPILLRPRAEQFIRFFDAKLIPLEAVGKGVSK